MEFDLVSPQIITALLLSLNSTLDGDNGLFSRSMGVVPSASDALF